LLDSEADFAAAVDFRHPGFKHIRHKGDRWERATRHSNPVAFEDNQCGRVFPVDFIFPPPVAATYLAVFDFCPVCLTPFINQPH